MDAAEGLPDVLPVCAGARCDEHAVILPKRGPLVRLGFPTSPPSTKTEEKHNGGRAFPTRRNSKLKTGPPIN
ncbi:hypothetical protein [Streptomyces sp. NPDC060366]|uniref:hypothetical protein n=1 Tax=Streptomyces sp. NPDC060366 TaxID=3347105 RepID=UPI0036461321